MAGLDCKGRRVSAETGGGITLDPFLVSGGITLQQWRHNSAASTYQRLRPKGSLGIDVLDLFRNVVGANLGKRSCKRGIFANEVAIQTEYVHESPCPNRLTRCLSTIARSEFSLAAR
jgi:hypothetical protein